MLCILRIDQWVRRARVAAFRPTLAKFFLSLPKNALNSVIEFVIWLLLRAYSAWGAFHSVAEVSLTGWDSVECVVVGPGSCACPIPPDSEMFTE